MRSGSYMIFWFSANKFFHYQVKCFRRTYLEIASLSMRSRALGREFGVVIWLVFDSRSAQPSGPGRDMLEALAAPDEAFAIPGPLPRGSSQSDEQDSVVRIPPTPRVKQQRIAFK